MSAPPVKPLSQNPSLKQSLTITWALSTVSGYGIYGLQILLQMLRRGADQIILTHQPAAIMLPALTQLKVDPYLELGRKISAVLKDQPEQHLQFAHPALHAVGNDFAGFPGQDRVHGAPNIGCAAIEMKICSSHAREIGKGYDKLIAISRWNETFLRQLDLAPVHLCYQGIDTSLFHPGPRTDLWKDRFVIFSGGKFEFRKGQDIVTRAFKLFHARHPDALLVTAWQNLLPINPDPFLRAGHVDSVPEVTTNGVQIGPWLAAQGLTSQSCIPLPYTPNMLMPAILRECDAALFPNRCEGGTNLVAMEAMACGIPTIVANNTGQKDLVELFDCIALNQQTAVQASPSIANAEDWGESDVDEILAALEKIYTEREAAKSAALKTADKLRAFDWAQVNDKLLDVVFS